MSGTGVVVIALSSALVLGACGSETNWNDLTSYMSDTGFQVAELTPDHSDLVMIASSCLGCD